MESVALSSSHSSQSSSPVRFILRKLTILLVSLTVIFSAPACVAAVTILATYHVIVVLLARIFHPELSALQGIDAGLAVESVYTKPEMCLINHLICEGDISLENLRLLFKNQVLNHRDPRTGTLTYHRLRQRCTTFMGYLFWTDDEGFDLNNHIRLYDYGNYDPQLTVPSPCTPADVVRVTGKLLGQPFKKGTSPWELILIPNYQSSDGIGAKKELVLCLRMHHSLGDGYSIIGIINRLFHNPMPPLATGKIAQKKQLPLAQRALRNLEVLLLLPYDLARLLVDTFTVKPHPWQRPQRSSGASITFCSERIDWDDVRTLMRKYEVSANAAIYSITAGAAFRLMKEAGQSVPSGKVGGGTAHPVSNHPGGLVNHLSVTYFTMRPGIQSGEKLVRQMGKWVRHASFLNRPAVFTYWALVLGTVFPAWLWKIIVAIGKSRVAPRFAFGVTSVPGPRRELEIEGLRLVDSITSLGHWRNGPTAAIATMMSIAGKVRIVFNVNEGSFEGYRVPQGFAKHVEDEIRALLNDEDCSIP